MRAVVVTPRRSRRGPSQPWPPPAPSQTGRSVVCWAVVGSGWCGCSSSRAVRITRPVCFDRAAPGPHPAGVPAGLRGPRPRRVARAAGSSAAAALLVVAYLALVDPGLGATSVPAWAAGAPRLTMLSANLFDENPTRMRRSMAVVDVDADVLVLVEIVAAHADRARDAGHRQRFPIPLSATSSASEREASRRSTPRSPIRRRAPGVGSPIGLPAGRVSCWVPRPSTWWPCTCTDPTLGVDEWRAELAASTRSRSTRRGRSCVAGDFNARRWNPQYAGLLGGGRGRRGGGAWAWPVVLVADRSLPAVRGDATRPRARQRVRSPRSTIATSPCREATTVVVVTWAVVARGGVRTDRAGRRRVPWIATALRPVGVLRTWRGLPGYVTMVLGILLLDMLPGVPRNDVVPWLLIAACGAAESSSPPAWPGVTGYARPSRFRRLEWCTNPPA